MVWPRNGDDSVRVLRDPVRVDHVRREGIEVARPGSFVLIAAYERRFVEDPQPVVSGHQRDQARQVTVIDVVDESQGEKDWRERVPHAETLFARSSFRQSSGAPIAVGSSHGSRP